MIIEQWERGWRALLFEANLRGSFVGPQKKERSTGPVARAAQQDAQGMKRRRNGRHC